jgi:hypothetical protein
VRRPSKWRNGIAPQLIQLPGRLIGRTRPSEGRYIGSSPVQATKFDVGFRKFTDST